ncbi:hypothetical protein DYD21_15255 [Rhodohalobacter sp. SW132]|uniref:hypothetical protein n=1 Tax=Rhodohalobacter sp. SW132 TaxID=2293433 RepID=UPI000E263C55|nr:hypothetical protein [Rhodohalobacter sp. SW132]REL29205.1 hypothetical protein DYD21_15255 [Rhodohalobacter sp. SW132]
MDIFKLIYEHDLRLDQLKNRHTDRSTQDISSTLEDFLKPDLTYSKFYFTGTRLDKEQFGLNILDRYDEIMEALDFLFDEYHIHVLGRSELLSEAVEKAEIGEPIVISKQSEVSWNLKSLVVDFNSNAGHKKESIAELLKSDDLLLYKEQAHNGFDLHLFSKNNIYRDLFYPLQALVNKQFRFFSINGKRVRSERKFYFETWTLERPPHGAEEVFPETVL